MPEFKRFRYLSDQAFLDDLHTITPEIPYSTDLSSLAQPLCIGGKEVPNRLAIHPMEGADGDAEGSPGELTLRRYQRFSGGGAGMVWFEATAVVADGRANPRQLYLHQNNQEAFRTLFQASLEAAESNCLPRPFTVLQLTHSGRQSFPGSEPQPIIAVENPILDRRPGRVITDDELERLRDAFVGAARLAADIGFDAVDIKACHGYLMGELLTAHTRPGKYGGSFENRTRLLVETVEAIKAELGGRIAVASRYGTFDSVPHPYGWGVDMDDYHVPDFSEPVRLAVMLAERGVCILDVTCGNPYFNPHVNRPFDHGFYTPPDNQMRGCATLLTAAKTIQAAVPQVAVIGTGFSWYRQHGANIAAARVRDGWFAMAGFGRQSFAYPDFAWDILENNGLDPKKCCVACGNCTVIMRDGGRSGCMVRDRDIYLPIYRHGRQDKPATDMSRVSEHI